MLKQLRRLGWSVLKIVEPALYAVVPRYAYLRARRDWDTAARRAPREVTATFDAGDWDTYWASGQRDLQVVLDVAQASGPIRSRRALDLGCGLGRLTRLLAERYEAVVGIDISPEMLQLARRWAPAPNVSYELVGPDRRLAARDGEIDLAIAWTVFRHVSRDTFKAYLAEIHRVLAPDACLVFEAQVRESGPPANPQPNQSYADREYTRDELRDACDTYGYRWAAERTTTSATPGSETLIMAWRKEVSAA